MSSPGVRVAATSGIAVKQYEVENLGKVFVAYENCLNSLSECDSTLSTTSDGSGLIPRRPGNGGCRVLTYKSEIDAHHEAMALAYGMSLKHLTYYTGFSGAKLVVRVPDTSNVNKVLLNENIAKILKTFNGSLYTGCDLNTTMADMVAIDNMAPYVLAGIESRVDPNIATGYGVVGSVSSCIRNLLNNKFRGTKVFVQGVGKVGSTVACLLQELGCQVLCSDVIAGAVERAVPGATDVSNIPWYDVDCDVFIPCAVSGLINNQYAKQLKCKVICGSANVPFQSEEALSIITQRGIHFVPEAISSAGAVIADSIEFFDPETFFSNNHPYPVYSFIRHACDTKATQYIQHIVQNPCTATPLEILHMIADKPEETVQLGKKFKSWYQNATYDADYVVIGGGMAGASAAMYLALSMKESMNNIGGGGSNDSIFTSSSSSSNSRSPSLENGMSDLDSTSSEDDSKSNPHSVVLLERGTLADIHGSSYGDSRMYREMQSDPFYSLLQKEAMPMWRDLEKRSGVSLLSQNGLLFYGENTEETVEGSIPGAANTMKQLNIPHEMLSAKEVKERYPIVNCSSQDMGLYEPTGGAVNATKAVSAFAQVATQAGAKIVEKVNVEYIMKKRLGRGKRVMIVGLSNGTFYQVNKRLVIAAGAWTGEILKHHLNVDLNTEIHSVAWGHYEIKENETDFPQWFCFREKTHIHDPLLENCVGLYYGFPSVPYHTQKHENETKNTKDRRMIKIGVDYTPNDTKHRPQLMSQFIRQPHPIVAKDIDMFMKHMWGEGLVDQVDIQCSPYSMTPDNDFILGHVPGYLEAVTFFGGCGRAFKFAPLLGACLSDIAQGKKPRYDISRFDPSRPTLTQSKQQ